MELTQSQMLLYELIRQNGGIEDKTKLAKLQYFADFIHYAFSDEPISQAGVIYTRQKQGPLSRDLTSDLEKLKEIGLIKEEATYNYHVAKEITTELPAKKLETIKYVINKYGSLSWKELVEIAHSQEPFLSADPSGVIEFFTAYNLVDYYPDYSAVA